MTLRKDRIAVLLARIEKLEGESLESQKLIAELQRRVAELEERRTVTIVGQRGLTPPLMVPSPRPTEPIFPQY